MIIHFEKLLVVPPHPHGSVITLWNFVLQTLLTMATHMFITIIRACFNRTFHALNTLMTHEITVLSVTH